MVFTHGGIRNFFGDRNKIKACVAWVAVFQQLINIDVQLYRTQEQQNTNAQTGITQKAGSPVLTSIDKWSDMFKRKFQVFFCLSIMIFDLRFVCRYGNFQAKFF